MTYTKKQCISTCEMINKWLENMNSKKRIAVVYQASCYTINKGLAWYDVNEEKPCWYSASSGSKKTFKNWTECHEYLNGIAETIIYLEL